MDEVEQLLERGKVMQLHGLSNAQWNGSIVSIDERFVENDGVIKFVCEVMFGENKGKKLKVKETNLIEIQPIPSKKLYSMKAELTKLRNSFEEVRDSTRSCKERDIIINSIYEKVNHMSTEVPNCCMLWDLIGKYVSRIFFTLFDT